MKQLKLLVAILLFAAATAQAQSVKIKWKQIQSGTTGQVAIVGVDGNGAWVTPPFLKLSDTAAMLAPYARVQRLLDTATAIRNVINTKLNISDTSAMLAAYVRVQRLVDTAASIQARINLKENLANKATDFSVVNNTLYPTTQAVSNFIQSSLTGVVKDRGNYNASTNTFPSTGGSGSGGAIMKGDMWYIANAGTLGGTAVSVGDWIRALVDAPGTTAANWAIAEGNLGFVPENVANKSTTTTLGTSNTLYPTQNAVKTYVDNAITAIGISGYVPTSRTITINGVPFDLSANRTWNVGTVTSIGITVPTGLQVSGSPVTTSGTIALTFQSGYAIPTVAKQINWDTAFVNSIVSASVTGTTSKTITLTQQDGGTVTANWSDLQDAYTDEGVSFTGSTSNTITLPHAPTSNKHLIVQLNGVTLGPSDWGVVGTTLTLSNVTREASDYIYTFYSY